MMRHLIVLFLAISISVPSFASDEKLKVGWFSKDQIRQIVGDYPAPGSAEEAYDYQVLLEYQKTRTEAECEEAAAEKTPTLKSMFGSLLTKKEMRRVWPHFIEAYATVGLNSAISKKLFDRPRPFNANPEIVPCIPLATSKAYPSGHTMIARVFARMLSDFYPDRENEFMQRADEVALNRIIGGVHHPSDIVAGKKLGDAIYESLIKD
ncbi:MAG: hypothetical protein COW01_03505 [Bdellovibrionales bacterium CG12_big_fil_rev_8_21_14_0_65_38_15]|nr:MAG: hypothetical protein COW79_02065 [Bdellovibrionales bacterium CG22_combo_CG10-13_8_21_14_all_38_13]PIQ56911.1 MAG: hypothetical protein COW01_03505 [Bdellovibrionales bacterium CG12_big_fil_rev_8_21_14_0_65_38_15]PIR30076.1 MAG: hypothetical protein COV38_07225 [Bdellovibrionales bacterium CG11_big_fil_rev_8_21_14_0_20_38_13]